MNPAAVGPRPLIRQTSLLISQLTSISGRRPTVRHLGSRWMAVSVLHTAGVFIADWTGGPESWKIGTPLWSGGVIQRVE